MLGRPTTMTSETLPFYFGAVAVSTNKSNKNKASASS